MNLNILGLQLRQNLIEIIEQSQLPPIVVLFILKDLVVNITDLTNQAATQELEALQPTENIDKKISETEVINETSGQE